MKQLHYLSTFFLLAMTATCSAYAQSDNTLSQKEIKAGWKLLFDGRSSDGWMNARTKKFPASGWDIKDGCLIIDPMSRGKDGGGDIVTTEKYGNFELSCDFLYKTGANSGIKYFVDTERDNGEMASIGCEYQILDDKNHPDAKEGIGGNRTLSGLYDLIAPKNTKDNGPGKWNTALIVVNGNKVQHWLNGVMTVEYDRSSPEWKAAIAISKFRNIPDFGEAAKGRILLQDHGDVVAFKNIKIREIR
jgi:3-keto-disaccharide hydrolase